MSRISDHVLVLLEQCSVIGNELTITCGQLDRKDYVSLNKVLEALGGKWNRKTKTHVFPNDPAARIEEAMLTREYSDLKKDFAFFETPPALAEEVIRLANILPEHWILEPSAGTGRLATAALRAASIKNIRCIELNVDRFVILESLGFKAYQKDFLSITPKPVFDRVVMNPPFSVPGRAQADIDHTNHAFKFLKPRGRLVSIMSAGVKFRENTKTKQFRATIQECQDNPLGSFKTSGTSINTVTIVMERRPGDSLQQ